MRRQDDERLTLSVEQRAAASFGPVAVALCSADDALALAVEERSAEPPSGAPTPVARIEQALAAAAEPISLAELRSKCGIRKATLISCLSLLSSQGRVTKTAAGYLLAQP
jgi:hypothetical protein